MTNKIKKNNKIINKYKKLNNYRKKQNEHSRKNYVSSYYSTPKKFYWTHLSNLFPI